MFMPDEQKSMHSHIWIYFAGFALIALWIVDYLQLFPGMQLSWYGLTPTIAGIIRVLMIVAVEVWKRMH